jgi:lysophospholipase L1-like esterase
MPRSLLVLAALVALAAPAAAEEKFFLHDGQRVVFLGDSNTYAGHYVTYVDAYLRTRFPDQKFELINLGLPSETVSGLSEPDHPYPRPDVHERLDRALARTKPDVVVACYGMNDGIYYPTGEERFRKYQDGIRRLIDRVKASGAAVVLMTTPPFDPEPVRDKLLPRSAERFSWMHPYEDYDDVLTRYSEWLLTLRDQGLPVADAHGAVNRYLAAARKADPKYRLAGDGIHPNATGHWLMAQELLRAWHAPAEVDTADVDVAARKVRHGDVTDLAVAAAEVRFTWRTRLPLPADPQWDPRLAEREQIAERFNRQRLRVAGLDGDRYELWEGDRRVGEASRTELAAGLDMTRFPELSTNARSAELGKLVEKRQLLLARAWLSAVGHKRPGTEQGLPLEETQRQAEPLDAQLRKLARPAALDLRLVPAKE